jgi:glycosyltransferase involved in cell wall biosynthesis
MRLLLFHGYLLRGTGSNVYNARLCAALVRQGHTIDLLCQENRLEELDFVDAVGTWHDGSPRVEVLREDVRLTAWRPDLGGLLPVYVADRYEGVQARTFLQCTDDEVQEYVARNVAAVRDVVARSTPDLALANHLVMGPLVLARALGGRVPYAVKIHGSALEYVVKRDMRRFAPAAREGLAGARTILVGSRHTAESLWAAMDDAGLPARTRLGPPGVDVEMFSPRSSAQARAEMVAVVERLSAEAEAAAAVVAAAGGAEPAASAFSRDAAEAAAALSDLDLDADRHVAFVGKLIVSKGVDLLAAAWPLVLQVVPQARLVIIGFGAYRPGLERLLAAFAAGDLDAVAALAREGRAAEGGPRAPLRHLLAFLEELEGGQREPYLAAAARLGDRVVLTGRLDHDELAPVIAACEAQVVPSTFPEAFGMVAAEAAACGVLPVSAAHSGLAEVSAILAAELPAVARPWLSFTVDDGAVRALAASLVAWLTAPEDLRAEVRRALAQLAAERFSWEGVARGVIAAAQGHRDELVTPG